MNRFNTLHARHSRWIANLVEHRLNGTGIDCDDVEQEVWLRVYRGLGTFRGESRFETWLTSVALNVCRSHLRAELRSAGFKARSDRWISRDLALDAVPAVIDAERSFGTLALGYRTVLLLKGLGYTHDEIGTRLGINSGTSKSQLAKGRRRFRQLMD